MIKRKSYLALAVAMSTTLALTACASGGGNNGGGGDKGGNAPTQQSADEAAKLVGNNPKNRDELEQGGQLTLDTPDWPTNWNGWHVDGNLASYGDVMDATDPSFYDYAVDGTITPRKEWLQEMPKSEMKDGKQVITYKLNPKAVWNDGTKIDWKSFEATWKAHRLPMDKGGYNNVSTTGYEDIESVKQGASADEVVVTMAKPFNPVTEIFGGVIHPDLGKDPKTFNEAMKSDVKNEWHAGPFKIENVDQQAKTIVLVPNEKWWGNKPLLSKVVYRFMEDSATIPAFKNGEIDATGVANKARFQQIQGANGLDIRRSQRTSTFVAILNAKVAPLNDINVRKAIWQAFDRESMRKVRFNGLNWTEKPANSAAFFSFQPEYEDNMPVQFDVEGAKKTLQDAGYTMGSDGYFAKDGKPLAVKYTIFGDDPLTAALGQTVQGSMKNAGIKIDLDVRPAAAFGPATEKRDFSIIQMGWSSNSPSPLTSICQIMCSDSGSNYANVGTPELDKKIKALGTIEDPKEQAKQINAVEKEFLQQYGQMPLWNGPAIVAVRKGLANWGPAAFASMHPKWEDVGWEKGSQHK